MTLIRTPPALVGEPAATDATVLDLVAGQARSRAGEPAVVHNTTVLSYGDLWQRSGGIAGLLAARDIGRGHIVGLAARRSVDLVIALLGILRAGAACLPLDPEYPGGRLSLMLADAEASAVLGHADVLARLPAESAVIALDDIAEAGWPAARGDDELPTPEAGDACYLIYTSGSTSAPKGVLQQHGCLANLVRWQRENSACGAGTRTAQFAPLSFDVSFQEIFCTLGTGGTLVCLDEADRRDPVRTWDVVARQGVHRLFLPFVAVESLAMFAALLPAEQIVLREVITAGEQLKCTAPVRALFGRMPGCSLVNQYGPTETHVVTSHTLAPDVPSWPLLPPIGRPIRGARLHVLDADLRPVPPGAVGELWVGGIPVARGYWRRPELTAQRFRAEDAISEHGRDRPAGRVYRTGDLVRVTPAGEVEFVGRADDQVKVSGIRVEPAEIEALVMEHPGVRAVAVVPYGTSSSNRFLLAYVVGPRDRHELAELRAHVRRALPEQLVPRLEPVEALPLTPSGKVDRRALRASSNGQEGGAP